MCDQLERFAADCLAVDPRQIPNRLLPFSLIFNVAEVVLLIPVTCFVEMIIG